MDILSFILGMSIVVVIAVAIVAVIGFFKAIKTEKELKDLIKRIETSPVIDEVHQRIEKEIDTQNREREVVVQEIYRKFDDQNRERDSIVNDIYRTIDSRLDKCR